MLSARTNRLRRKRLEDSRDTSGSLASSNTWLLSAWRFADTPLNLLVNDLTLGRPRPLRRTVPCGVSKLDPFSYAEKSLYAGTKALDNDSTENVLVKRILCSKRCVMFARRAVGRTSSSRLPGLLARCNLLRVGMLKLIGSCHSTSRPCSASAYVCQATDAAHVERVFSGSLASTSCSYSPSTPSYRRLAGWSAPSKVATVRMPAGRARAAASGSGAVSWPTEAIGQVSVPASPPSLRLRLRLGHAQPHPWPQVHGWL